MPPASRCFASSVLSVRPADLNARGTVFGGTVIALAEAVAARAAGRFAEMPVTTAALDMLRFEAPLGAYDRIELRAQGTRTFRTSLEVQVRIDGSDPRSGRRWHTSDATFTLVALGPDGRPAPFPRLEPETPEERARWEAAARRRELRLRAPEEPAPDYEAHGTAVSDHLSFEISTDIVHPASANELGRATAGWIFSVADRLAGIASARHAGQTTVTAAVDSVYFRLPILVAEIAVIRAYLTRAFRTSMEVRAEVWKRSHAAARPERVATAYFTMVAVDPRGRPVEVPPLRLRSELDRRLYEAAGQRRELRRSGFESLEAENSRNELPGSTPC